LGRKLGRVGGKGGDCAGRMASKIYGALITVSLSCT